MRRAALAWRLVGLGIAVVAASCTPLFADSGEALSLGATGTVSSYLQLSYPQSALYGRLEDPAVAAACESVASISAQSPSLLFRLRVAALAQGDKPSTIDPTDASNLLSFEVREAETAILPSPSFAIRGGMLLRNFSVGSYGSPANPFARDVDQGGFWGLDAEWTPGSSLSALAILSADRTARRGSFDGPKDFDAGALLRFSPGALDAAAGLYASGAGDGEVRPVAYCSVPVLGLLASLEAAVSLPLGLAASSAGAGDGSSSESLRFELRKSLDVGQTSIELGAAYRGIFPGRSAGEVAALAAQTAVSGPPALPFAPFYGRNYAELSLYAEKTNAFSLTSAASLAIPWGSVTTDTKVELYAGDAGIFVRVQWIDGAAQGEFNTLARAEGLSLLVLWTGVEFSF